VLDFGQVWHMDHSERYPLYDQHEETISHLLVKIGVVGAVGGCRASRVGAATSRGFLRNVVASL
jgi:hypothetical protein